MEETEARVFAQAWLARWTGNQPELLLESYADDAFYRDPAVPKGLKGTEALRGYFTKLLYKNPDWRWQAVEVIPTAKGFVLKWRANIPVGRVGFDEEGLDIVELKDGRITRNEVYFDRTAWHSLISGRQAALPSR